MSNLAITGGTGCRLENPATSTDARPLMDEEGLKKGRITYD